MSSQARRSNSELLQQPDSRIVPPVDWMQVELSNRVPGYSKAVPEFGDMQRYAMEA